MLGRCLAALFTQKAAGALAKHKINIFLAATNGCWNFYIFPSVFVL